MYIEQLVEASENKTKVDSQQGSSISAIDPRRLVVYELPRKLVRSLNNRQVCLENMAKFGENSKDPEATFAVKNKISSNVELPSIQVENIEKVNESGEEKYLSDKEKTRDNAEDGITGNEELAVNCKKEEDDGNDDSFDEDDDQEATGLFGNKLQSIFIRRSTIECDGEESIRKTKELCHRHSDKWIDKKDDTQTRKLKKKHALSFVDTMITLFIVGPLVIGQWRGIWGMMDIYTDYFPEWLCFVLGTTLHVVFAIARDGLHGRFVEKWRTYSWLGRVAYDFVRLIYTYVFCVACNAQWRGGWMIFSEYFTSNTVITCLFTTLFTAGLLILRTSRNLLAPPFIVVIDQPDRVFKFPTRYNVEISIDEIKNGKKSNACCANSSTNC